MTRTARREFPNRIRAEAYLRADGKCEEGGATVKHKPYQVDHIIPCWQGGEPTLDNARVLCVPCHRPKSAEETRQTAKADRLRRKHIGAAPKKSKIPYRTADGQCHWNGKQP